MKDLLRKASVCGAIMAASAAGMSLAAESGSDPLSLNPSLAPTVATTTDEAKPAGQQGGALYLDDAAPAAAAPAPKKITGSIAVVVPTKYISRGLILNNDNGVIAQPQAEIDFNVYANDNGFVTKVTPYVGIWNDLTSARRATNSNPRHLSNWYEFDWDAGAVVDFKGGFEINAQYIEFTSPSNSFGTSKNINVNLNYDDSPWWKGGKFDGFALKPYVTVLIETNGKAGDGKSLGQYIEPGLDPTYTFLAKSTYPVTIDVPMKVGLGINNFYGGANNASNKTLGYISVGVNLSIPLPFMDKSVGGSWSLTAGGAYYYYGDGTHAFNEAVHSSRHDGIGAVGLTCKF